MIGGADFQAVQPSIEILNVPAKVAVAELDRIHRTLDLEAGEGATAVSRGLRHREHSYRDNVGEGNKHPLALVEGATENAATVQALLDNLVSRGLAPTVPRLFIVDGAKALSKAIRRTFGSAAAVQRCQIHKARNIAERLPKEHHAATRRVLRQAWELDDADKAEKLIRNLARQLDQQWPGVAASILEGLDEILTVVRLKLPKELRRSLACTNIAENMMGTIRRVTRNVKRWRDAGMALRWVAAGMIEANKGFRRLKAHKQLSVLRAALQAHHDRMTIKPVAHVTRAA